MKVLILFLMACAFANAQLDLRSVDQLEIRSGDIDAENKWLQFKLEFGKFFLSPGKEAKRKEVFLDNIKGLDEHNAAFERGDVTYSVGINQWADLTDEEFESRFMGIPKEPETRAGRPSESYLNAAVPASLDLRTDAGVTPVKNQNPCGSCWAFSTVSALEYAVWKKTGRVLDLSEQQLVDCTGYADGCQGGWMYEAMDYIYSSGGIYYETDYPYTFSKYAGTCTTPNRSKPVQLNSPSYMVFANQDATIKAALKYYGVLSICVDATGWRWTMSGIFQSPKVNEAHTCTHAISLVGYGTENGRPYWLIKNSWTDQWGEKGYLKLDATRYSDNRVVGGITFYHTYWPLVK